MTSFRISEEEFEKVSEWAVQLRLGVAKRYSHDDDLGLIAIDAFSLPLLTTVARSGSR